MKKKLLLVCCSIALVLSACGGGSSSNTTEANKAESVEEESEEEINTEVDDVPSEPSESVESEDKVTSEEDQPTSEIGEQNTTSIFDNWIVRRNDSFKSGFSNGYKWIIIDDPRGYQYFGAVDKSGKLRFYLDKVSQMGPFSDSGKSFFESYDGKFYSVTVDGIVSPEFENEKGSLEILADYSCFCERQQGFDTNQLIYNIYNPEGELIEEITYESDSFPDLVQYHGNGIFEFLHNVINPPTNSSVYADFYCGKTDVLVKDQAAWALKPYANGYFTEGDYLLYYYGTNGGSDFLFTIIDDEGNWKDIYTPSEYGNDLNYMGASDYGILFADNDKHYFLYDVKKDSFRRFDGKYADKIISGFNMLGNESLAFKLEGDDKRGYLGIYDIESFEMLCEPILAEDQGNNGHPTYVKTEDNNNYKPSNDYYNVVGGDHMYYGTGKIYTKNGDAIKTLSNSTEIKYSEGVYQCLYENGEEDEALSFYDDDWNLLFTSKSIDYSIAKEIEY